MNAPASFANASIGFAAAKPRVAPSDIRFDILKEIVAGVLWMALDPPDETPLSELEFIAARLITRIQRNTSPQVIEAEIGYMLRHQFGQLIAPAVVSSLVTRIVAVVGRHTRRAQ